jgi:hypothetical protein
MLKVRYIKYEITWHKKIDEGMPVRRSTLSSFETNGLGPKEKGPPKSKLLLRKSQTPKPPSSSFSCVFFFFILFFASRPHATAALPLGLGQL